MHGFATHAWERFLPRYLDRARTSASGAGNAGVARRPVEEERFPTDHIRGNWAKFGDAAVETVAEVIADYEEHPFRNFCGFEH